MGRGSNWNWSNVIGAGGVGIAILALAASVWDTQASIADSSKRAQEDRKAALDQELRSVAPFLCVVDQCNHRNIAVRTDKRFEPIVVTASFNQLRSSDSSEISPIQVAKVKNLGGGAAVTVDATWFIKSVVYKEDVPIDVDDWDSDPQSVSPMMLAPGDVGLILWMPEKLRRDFSFGITKAFGSIVFRCKDISGKVHGFTQEFSAETHFQSLDRGYVNTGVISDDEPGIDFHFFAVTEHDGQFPAGQVALKPMTIHPERSGLHRVADWIKEHGRQATPLIPVGSKLIQDSPAVLSARP